MLANSLAAFLKLCAKDRAEIAMALWESLTDAEREAEVPTPEVSLSGVPKDAADGELFSCCRATAHGRLSMRGSCN